MRTVAILASLVVLVAGVGWASPPVGARTAEKSTRFCKAVDTFSGLTTTLAGVQLKKKDAAALAGALRSAAKLAPSKVKRAMKRLATLYERIASAKNPGRVFSANAEALIGASTTFGTYYTQQCTAVLLPTTTPG
jgi:hypothetical protein